MCADHNNATVTEAATQQQLLTLSDICLDFKLKTESFTEDFTRFLEKNRTELGLEGAEDIAIAYIEKVWPDNLPGSMIVSNSSFDQFDRWIIRPPVDGPMATAFAANGLVPTFSTYRRQGAIVVDSFTVTSHIAPRRFERYISGQIHINPKDYSMSTSDFGVLAQLPKQRQQTNEQLNLWKECLDWRKKLVFIGQIAFRYEGYEVGEDGNIRFLVRSNRRLRRIAHRNAMVMLAASLIDSLSPELWQPVPNTRVNFVRVGEVVKAKHSKKASRLANDRNDDTAGSEEGPGMAVITIKPGPNGDGAFDETLMIPDEGFLLSAVGGDIKPINSERRAINRLCTGQSNNWYLADYMFDIRNAAASLNTVGIPAGSSSFATLNTNQQKAVSKALAGDDIVLIQGPPGTGKTTLIVAVCNQQVSSGHRILVASQTNIAVDNVLSRLSKDPAVRPLRIGRKSRVEPEFRVFLPDNVLEPWLNAVVHTCRQSVEDNDLVEQKIKKAEEAFSSMETILDRCRDISKQTERHTNHRTKLRKRFNNLTSQKQELASQQDNLERQRAVLNQISSSTDKSNWQVQSTELLSDTGIKKLAETAVKKLAKELSGSRWSFPWLKNYKKGDCGNLFSILSWIQQSIEAAKTLPNIVLEAKSLCCGADSQTRSKEAVQIAKLLDKKAKLINSADDNDLLEVASINRRIKELQSDSWGQFCRIIRSSLEIIFQDNLPSDLDELTASLQPDSKWSDVLENMSQLCLCLTVPCHQILNDSFVQIARQAKKELAKIDTKTGQLQGRIKNMKTGAEELAYQIEEIEQTIENLQSQLNEHKQRWSELWPYACPDVDEPAEATTEISSTCLQQRRGSFDNWLSTNAVIRRRNNKWRSIQQDWIGRLEKPETAGDKDLNRLYVANANVIGLTCLESGQRSFYESDDFKPFDTVIIDEVSKATATELLMPMMLARNVVMVGDHRQLPPMFKERESSFSEAVEEGQVKREDFERFGKLVTSSFFENLFDSAPDSIRQSLFVGFRSHSQIMAVYNQFYGGKLTAAGGTEKLDKLRQHHLSIRDRRGGWFLEPHQHVLWIDSTKDPEGRIVTERQVRSSKANPLEIELVAASLMRLNWALRNKGYSPCKKAKAKSTENSITLQAWARKLLPRAADETIADIFSRGQVKIAGHATGADYIVKSGDKLQLDARMPVGVITFYGAQLGQLRRKIAQIIAKDPCYLEAVDIKTNTVDRFQGMEMPIVIVSLVRASEHKHVGRFVKEYRRVNVALSRAQKLLVIVGSERTFCNSMIELPDMVDGVIRNVPVYKNIYDLVTQFGGRRYARDLLKW